MVDPALFNSICALTRDLLRFRAGTRADDLAFLQRLVADLTAELGAKVAEADDEILTVTKAAKLWGVSTVTMRKYVRKYNIGTRDPYTGDYRVSKRKLLAVPARRGVSTSKQFAP